MGIMKGIKKMINNIAQAIKEPEQNKDLIKWKNKLIDAKSSYEEETSRMNISEAQYNGTREVKGNANSNKAATKLANNVRNITYELIESQVDSSIPAPKVTAVHEEDKEVARMLENFLTNIIKRSEYTELNDLNERMTPIMGGDFFHVEWDTKKGRHCNLGDISVSERSPKQIIPQPGVTDIDKMDYIFILVSQTKDFVKRKFGVDVSLANEQFPEIRDDKKNRLTSDLVTVNMCYYRNKEGGIGLFIWCDDYILEDLEDYQARQLEHCTKCGEIKSSDVCQCGSKTFKKQKEDMEPIFEDIATFDGTVINAYQKSDIPVLDESGNQITDENGNLMFENSAEQTKIPFYKPNTFPLVLRKNVSRSNKLLGFSDAEVIQDQQDTIKKLGSKINEKVLSGGSILTLPEGLNIKLTDEELKIVRVNSSQYNQIKAINLQVDVSTDRVILNDNYEAAKSNLGITDAFQGKYDPSATSGTAKNLSINQAAGRLESKRTMKNAAYAKLYRLIFEFYLAYADQKVHYSSKGLDGEEIFGEFDRYKFIKIDASGEMYFNDEFEFGTDPTSSIMSNRQSMWNQNDMKLQSGAFGPLGDDRTNFLYWSNMEDSNYPNAGKMKKQFAERIQQAQQATAQQAQLTPQTQPKQGVAQ